MCIVRAAYITNRSVLQRVSPDSILCAGMLDDLPFGYMSPFAQQGPHSGQVTAASMLKSNALQTRRSRARCAILTAHVEGKQPLSGSMPGWSMQGLRSGLNTTSNCFLMALLVVNPWQLSVQQCRCP